MKSQKKIKLTKHFPTEGLMNALLRKEAITSCEQCGDMTIEPNPNELASFRKQINDAYEAGKQEALKQVLEIIDNQPSYILTIPDKIALKDQLEILK